MKHIKESRLTGIIFTILISFGFIWAIVQWFNLYKVAEISIEEKQKNEIKAFENISVIRNAQEEYKNTDWDKNGTFVYSSFLAHLWKTLNENEDPMKINLLSRKLAFASEISTPVNGYMYEILYTHVLEGRERRRNDFSYEYAIYVHPSSRGVTGLLSFIFDQKENIWVSEKETVYNLEFPVNSIDKWMKINTIEELKNIQGKISYKKK